MLKDGNKKNDLMQKLKKKRRMMLNKREKKRFKYGKEIEQ